MEPTTIPTYQCPICETVYKTKEDAQKCIDRGTSEPVAKVGDIVVAKYGYWWFDGKPEWVANLEITKDGLGFSERMDKNHPKKNRSNCFSKCCTLGFYYVVTHIDTDSRYGKHQHRYHLETMAMTGQKGHSKGYTFQETHIKIKKVDNPPESVLKDSKALIGNTVGWLL